MIGFKKYDNPKIIQVKTNGDCMHDITSLIKWEVNISSVKNGLVNVAVQSTKAAIMIHQNGEASPQTYFPLYLQQIVTAGLPAGSEDQLNTYSYLKASIIGPSENISIMNGHLGLLPYQKIYLCEFDSPGKVRNIIVKIIKG